MNVVFETLFLRRPKIEYVSPPVCPVNFSASGVSFIDQDFNEDEFCPMRVLGNYLGFDQPADGLAYNVYSAATKSGILANVVSGLPAGFAAVVSPGVYWVTAQLPNGGESAPGPAVAATGSNYVQVKLVPGSVLNLYKDGVKAAIFSGTVVESNQDGWMLATKITTDGESPLVTSCGPVFVPAVPPLPPPPPCPGPGWGTDFAYGTPMCLHCEGVLIPFSAIPNCSGGLLPPSASFNAVCQLIGGNPSVEFIINQEGTVFSSYTGPGCTCELTLTNIMSGSLYTDQSFVTVAQDGVQRLMVGRATPGASGPLVPGTTVYPFSLLPGVNSVISVTIEQGVVANSLLAMQGSFRNTC